jgi:hypothetical protein
LPDGARKDLIAGAAAGLSLNVVQPLQPLGDDVTKDL